MKIGDIINDKNKKKGSPEKADLMSPQVPSKPKRKYFWDDNTVESSSELINASPQSETQVAKSDIDNLEVKIHSQSDRSSDTVAAKTQLDQILSVTERSLGGNENESVLNQPQNSSINGVETESQRSHNKVISESFNPTTSKPTSYRTKTLRDSDAENIDSKMNSHSKFVDDEVQETKNTTKSNQKKLRTELGTELRTSNTKNSEQNAEHDSIILRTEDKTKNTTKSNQKKLRTELGTELRTSNTKNSEQNAEHDSIILRTELRTNLTPLVPYSCLSGLQLKIIDVIYYLCRKNRSRITDKISLNFLSKFVQSSPAAVQVIERRIIKKNIMFKFESKEGRGGWSRYALVDEIYNEILELDSLNKLRTELRTDIDLNSEQNVEQDCSKLGTDQRTKLRTPPSSMYVGNLNNNTIHTEQPKQSSAPIDDPWLELRDVDFSLTEQFGIRSNVIETFRKNKWAITGEQLEEHLERFVRYFTEKEFEKRREPIKNPYSFFLSSIKAISKGEPDPICDIETQFEISQKMALQNKIKSMEIRRREFEAIEKQIDHYRDSEFEHWVQGLSDEEKTQIIPPNKIAELGSGRYKILLKDYFNQTVWPEIKQNVLSVHSG
jgi:hypothetical protein